MYRYHVIVWLAWPRRSVLRLDRGFFPLPFNMMFSGMDIVFICRRGCMTFSVVMTFYSGSDLLFRCPSSTYSSVGFAFLLSSPITKDTTATTSRELLKN
jgi:hypothetical protein